ncbi:MAG: N-acetyl-alpha-D-glucosaminyl L-malate synthase BshA [Myxococcota bacterium]
MRSLTIATLCLPGLGGSGRIAADLSDRLRDRGHHVQVFASARPAHLSVDSPTPWVPVEVESYAALPHAPYSLAMASKVAELQDVDLIHAHYAIPHANSAHLAKQIIRMETGREVPFVVTLHGTDVVRRGPMRACARATKLALHSAQGVTVPSAFLAREARAAFQLEAEQVAEVPNFVDPDLNHPPREHRPDGPTLNLVHVSNLRIVKRVQDILYAMTRLPPRVRLNVVGEGPQRGQLESLTRTLRLQERVRFFGRRNDVPDILRSSDVFVFPSQVESFGLAALEASACGLPVVASDVGGLPEVVEDGVSGLLFPSRDVDALADRVRQLMDGPELRRRMGEAGRSRALRFGPAASVDAYENLYARLVRRPS